MQLRKMQIFIPPRTQAQLGEMSTTLLHGYLSTPINTKLQMLLANPCILLTGKSAFCLLKLNPALTLLLLPSTEPSMKPT